MTLRQLLSLPLVGIVALLRLASPVVKSYVRYSCRERPLHYGLRIASAVPDKSNEVLIQDRVIGALSLLAVHSPIHLRWLQRAISVIFIAPLRGGRPIQLVPEAGIFRLNPLLVWKFSREELTLELAAAATRFRFHMAHVKDQGANRLPIGRRAILERIWLAERLNLSKADIAYWKAKLLTIPDRRSSGRTSGHVDAGRQP